MKYQSKHVQSKSGRTILIRTLKRENAQALIDLKRDYIKDTTTLPLTLDEYPCDLEKETQLIEEYNKNDSSILLAAIVNDRLIGNIDLTVSKRSKMAHTAMLGMGIQENWRNQGIGLLLIKAVIDWAKNHSPIELIWLDVYSSNELGYHLYQKMGFKASGKIPSFFKEKGQYIDKIQMYLDLK